MWVVTRLNVLFLTSSFNGPFKQIKNADFAEWLNQLPRSLEILVSCPLVSAVNSLLFHCSHKHHTPLDGHR